MAECLFTVTPEQIQDILGHVTEGVCRPFKVHINNLVYLTIILTLVPSSCHYIDCLLLFIYLYCDNFSFENIYLFATKENFFCKNPCTCISIVYLNCTTRVCHQKNKHYLVTLRGIWIWIVLHVSFHKILLFFKEFKNLIHWINIYVSWFYSNSWLNLAHEVPLFDFLLWNVSFTGESGAGLGVRTGCCYSVQTQQSAQVLSQHHRVSTLPCSSYKLTLAC